MESLSKASKKSRHVGSNLNQALKASKGPTRRLARSGGTTFEILELRRGSKKSASIALPKPLNTPSQLNLHNGQDPTINIIAKAGGTGWGNNVDSTKETSKTDGDASGSAVKPRAGSSGTPWGASAPATAAEPEQPASGRDLSDHSLFSGSRQRAVVVRFALCLTSCAAQRHALPHPQDLLIAAPDAFCCCQNNADFPELGAEPKSQPDSTSSGSVGTAPDNTSGTGYNRGLGPGRDDDRGQGRPRYDRGGFRDRGYGDRGSFDRGYDRGPYDRGHDRGSFDAGSYDRRGGYDRGSYDRGGFGRGNRGGFERSYNRSGSRDFGEEGERGFPTRGSGPDRDRSYSGDYSRPRRRDGRGTESYRSNGRVYNPDPNSFSRTEGTIHRAPPPPATTGHAEDVSTEVLQGSAAASTTRADNAAGAEPRPAAAGNAQAKRQPFDPNAARQADAYESQTFDTTNKSEEGQPLSNVVVKSTDDFHRQQALLNLQKEKEREKREEEEARRREEEARLAAAKRREEAAAKKLEEAAAAAALAAVKRGQSTPKMIPVSLGGRNRSSATLRSASSAARVATSAQSATSAQPPQDAWKKPSPTTDASVTQSSTSGVPQSAAGRSQQPDSAAPTAKPVKTIAKTTIDPNSSRRPVSQKKKLFDHKSGSYITVDPKKLESTKQSAKAQKSSTLTSKAKTTGTAGKTSGKSSRRSGNNTAGSSVPSRAKSSTSKKPDSKASMPQSKSDKSKRLSRDDKKSTVAASSSQPQPSATKPIANPALRSVVPKLSFASVASGRKEPPQDQGTAVGKPQRKSTSAQSSTDKPSSEGSNVKTGSQDRGKGKNTQQIAKEARRKAQADKAEKARARAAAREKVAKAKAARKAAIVAKAKAKAAHAAVEGSDHTGGRPDNKQYSSEEAADSLADNSPGHADSSLLPSSQVFTPSSLDNRDQEVSSSAANRKDANAAGDDAEDGGGGFIPRLTNTFSSGFGVGSASPSWGDSLSSTGAQIGSEDGPQQQPAASGNGSTLPQSQDGQPRSGHVNPHQSGPQHAPGQPHGEFQRQQYPYSQASWGRYSNQPGAPFPDPGYLQFQPSASVLGPPGLAYQHQLSAQQHSEPQHLNHHQQFSSMHQQHQQQLGIRNAAMIEQQQQQAAARQRELAQNEQPIRQADEVVPATDKTTTGTSQIAEDPATTSGLNPHGRAFVPRSQAQQNDQPDHPRSNVPPSPMLAAAADGAMGNPQALDIGGTPEVQVSATIFSAFSSGFSTQLWGAGGSSLGGIQNRGSDGPDLAGSSLGANNGTNGNPGAGGVSSLGTFGFGPKYEDFLGMSASWGNDPSSAGQGEDLAANYSSAASASSTGGQVLADGDSNTGAEVAQRQAAAESEPQHVQQPSRQQQQRKGGHKQKQQRQKRNSKQSGKQAHGNSKKPQQRRSQKGHADDAAASSQPATSKGPRGNRSKNRGPQRNNNNGPQAGQSPENNGHSNNSRGRGRGNKSRGRGRGRGRGKGRSGGRGRGRGNTKTNRNRNGGSSSSGANNNASGNQQRKKN